MTNSTSYQLVTSDAIFSHGFGGFGVVRDHEDTDKDRPDLEAEALVASGDCLISLATSLDQVTEMLADEDEVARPQIEKTISTLLYLQRRYRLVPKKPEHRQ
jgi:hypothetical protein